MGPLITRPPYSAVLARGATSHGCRTDLRMLLHAQGDSRRGVGTARDPRGLSRYVPGAERGGSRAASARAPAGHPTARGRERIHRARLLCGCVHGRGGRHGVGAQRRHPAYNLAVVVDDAHQGIDQVVRGDDLLSSAPRQAYLAGLLGYPAPEYVHVPSCWGQRVRGWLNGTEL